LYRCTQAAKAAAWTNREQLDGRENTTYGADILKEAINGEGVLPLWVSFPVLFFFAAGLFAFSLYNIRRKWVL